MKAAINMHARMMHFAIILPNWNSLESVRRAHSELEAAALIFFALLVVSEALAHLVDDKKMERLFDRIGVVFFAIAVLAEIVAYPYGQRNDTLSSQMISSLSHKAGEADAKAKIALTDSGTALTQAGLAGDESDQAEEKADSVSKEANALAIRIHELNGQVEAIGPRAIVLGRAEEDLLKKISPFAGQEFTAQICGQFFPIDRERKEKLDTWASIFHLLDDEGKWKSTTRDIVWENCTAARVGVFVFVNMSAPPKTMKAARVLSEELTRVFPPQPQPVLMLSGSDFGLPPIDEQAPSVMVKRDHGLIAVLIGEQPTPRSKGIAKPSTTTKH